jgi:hypothetical protein
MNGIRSTKIRNKLYMTSVGKSEGNKTDVVHINVTVRCVRAIVVAVEKQLSVTYSECVPLALVIHHAICMRHIVICGLSGCTVFFHII